jgi:hypothetical protein
VINDPVKRKVFLDTVLGEFLDASKAYPDQIFAWEVMNEPFWLTTGFGPLSPAVWLHRIPEVSEAIMIDFLNDAVHRIDSAGFQSTVGHRFLSDLDTFPTGKVRQFHYYAKSYAFTLNVPAGTPLQTVHFGDPPTIPAFSQTNAIIGEIGGTSMQSARWPELPPGNQSPKDRLTLLESKGYERVWMWGDIEVPPGNSVPDPIKLSQPTRQSIVDYTGGRLPDVDE